MESERIVLVCLKNRTREVRLELVGDDACACTTTPFSVDLLDKAVRAKFADLPCLADTSGSCSIDDATSALLFARLCTPRELAFRGKPSYCVYIVFAGEE